MGTHEHRTRHRGVQTCTKLTLPLPASRQRPLVKPRLKPRPLQALRDPLHDSSVTTAIRQEHIEPPWGRSGRGHLGGRHRLGRTGSTRWTHPSQHRSPRCSRHLVPSSRTPTPMLLPRSEPQSASTPHASTTPTIDPGASRTPREHQPGIRGHPRPSRRLSHLLGVSEELCRHDRIGGSCRPSRRTAGSM
jgi:hypothetical protein